MKIFQNIFCLPLDVGILKSDHFEEKRGAGGIFILIFPQQENKQRNTLEANFCFLDSLLNYTGALT